MSSPIRCEYSVPGTKYEIEVDLKKWDCNKEPAHCHVTDCGRRIAQVWLSSCLFEDTPRNVSFADQRRILDRVAEKKYELQNAYEHNRVYGAD